MNEVTDCIVVRSFDGDLWVLRDAYMRLRAQYDERVKGVTLDTTPTFRFKFLRARRDTTGYYFVRWDEATTVTVIAPTEKEARAKALAMSAALERPWSWVFRIATITEVGPATEDRHA